MTSNPYLSELYPKSTISHTQKRDVLWNVLEPGDPYDIKRSMIANLPGKKRTMLQGKPDMVCLLQAAQIQRLNEYLQEYEVRYKEAERKEIDRHSYEIQIKELTEKMKDQEELQHQNQKLKEFIKKLKAESQELRRGGFQDKQFKQNYENALLQISKLRTEIQRLNAHNQTQTDIINNYKSQIQALHKAKQKELDDLYHTLSQNQKIQSSHQLQETKLKHDGELRSLQRELQRCSEALKLKSMENEDLITKIKYLESEHRRLSEKAEETSELQRINDLYTQQIQRLMSTNKQISRERVEFQTKVRDLNGELNRMGNENRRLSDENTKYRNELVHAEKQNSQLIRRNNDIHEYEEKIVQSGGQIDRLHNVLKNRTNQLNRLNQEHEQLLYKLSKFDILERQNVELKNNVEYHKKTNSDYENKLIDHSSEIEKMKILNNRLKDENGTLKHENNSLKQNVTENGFKITQIKQEYERNIRDITHKTDRELEGKVNQVVEEIDRLNRLLETEKRKNEKLEKKIRQMEEYIDHQEREGIQVIHNQKKKLQSMEERNSELEKKNYDLKAENRQISEKQNQINILKKDYERLISDCQSKDTSIRDLKDKIYQLESLIQLKENEVVENNYRMKSLSEQNEMIRREGHDKGRNLEELKKENENLHDKIQTFTTKTTYEVNQLTKKTEFLQNENKTLREQIARQSEASLDQNNFLKNQYDSQINQVNEKNLQIENKYVLIVTEVQRLQHVLREKDDKIKKILHQLEEERSNLRDLENRYLEATDALEELNREKQRSLRNLEGEKNHQKQKITVLELQIERLNEVLGKKVGECSELKNRSRNTEVQNESLKNKLFYMENANSMSKIENEELRKKIHETDSAIGEYETRFPSINDEIDRLQSLIAKRDELIDRQDEKLKSREEIITRLKRELYEIGNQKIDAERSISELENEISRLRQEIKFANDENGLLKKRLADIEEDYRRKEMEILEKLEKAKHEKAIVERQLLENENEFNKEKFFKNELSKKVEGLENDKKFLEKRKDKTDTNLAYTMTRIAFLEEEGERLKRQKNKIQANESKLLKNDLEKLAMENLQLKNYIGQLNEEIDIRAETHKNEVRSLIEQYDERIRQLEKEKKNAFDKEKVKGMVKKINEDAQTKHKFYEDEIQRMKNDKKENTDRQKRQIEEIQTALDHERIKFSSLSEKFKNTEFRYHQLDDDYEALVNELTNKEAERRRIQSDYDYLRKKYEDEEHKNSEKTKKIFDLENLLDRVQQETQEMRRTQEYKNRQYEVTVGALERKNADLSDEVGYLQKQLGDRQKKITQLKLKESKMVSHIRELQATIEQLLSKYRNRENELETTVRSHRELKDSIYDYNQTKIKLSKTEQEIEYLANELQSAKELNERTKASNEELHRMNRSKEEQKNKYISECEVRINNFETTVYHLTNVNEELRDQLEDSERKFRELSQLLSQRQDEIENLQHLLNEKIDELSYIERTKNDIIHDNEGNKRKVSKLQNDLQKMNKQTSQAMINLERNLNEVGRQNHELRKQKASTTQQYNSKVSQYENRIAIISQEVENLHRKASDKEKALQERIRQLEEDNANLRRGLEELSNEHSHKTLSYEKNITSLSNQLRKKSSTEDQLNKKLQDNESQKHFSNLELNKLRQILVSKDDEINHLKREKEDNYRKFERASAERDGETRKVLLEQAEYKNLLIEYKNLQNSVKDYQGSLRKMQTEFERLQTIIDKLKKEREVSHTKNRSLMIEVDRLKKINSDLETRLEQLGLRISDEAALEKRVKEHLALFVVLFAEIQSLRSRILAQEREIEEVRRDSLQPLRL